MQISSFCLPGDDEHLVVVHAAGKEVFAAQLVAHMRLCFEAAGSNYHRIAHHIGATHNAAPAKVAGFVEQGTAITAMSLARFLGIPLQRLDVVAVIVIAIGIAYGTHFRTIIDSTLGLTCKRTAYEKG